MPSQFVGLTGSIFVPAWVMENENRTFSPPDPTQIFASSPQSEATQTEATYLLDGPTYPIADGGSAVKDALIRSLLSRGIKVKLIAANWAHDKIHAYNHLRVPIKWMDPADYFSIDNLRKMLIKHQCRFLIVDSAETMYRCAQFWPPTRMLAVLFDDYAHISRDRGASAMTPEAMRSTTRQLIADGMHVAVRGQAYRSELIASTGSKRIYRLDGISLRASRRRRWLGDGGNVVVGNFRYGPNSSGLAAMLRQGVAFGREMTVVGDLSETQRAKLQGEGIYFTGVVPRVEPFIARAGVAIDPCTSGSGISTKILTYVSQGTPVVCTKFAARGVHPTVSATFHTVDTASELLAAAEYVRKSFKRWCLTAETARKSLVRFHDIDAETTAIASAIARTGR